MGGEGRRDRIIITMEGAQRGRGYVSVFAGRGGKGRGGVGRGQVVGWFGPCPVCQLVSPSVVGVMEPTFACLFRPQYLSMLSFLNNMPTHSMGLGSFCGLTFSWFLVSIVFSVVQW